MKKIKVILDFDGTLTDEVEQVRELAIIGKKMLAEEILGESQSKIDKLYAQLKKEILTRPHCFCWEVNNLPATYAYEGAYLLNTSILQNLIVSRPSYRKIIEKKFPADNLDSITKCSNYIFHTGSLQIKPHFLRGVRKFLLKLIKHPAIEPVILSNSETRKIGKNLSKIKLGEKGTKHSFAHEIAILGDTRQYHMDGKWDYYFEHQGHGKIQVLPINEKFTIDLRRPVYHQALLKVMEEGNDEVVVIADGFSLAGSLPLVMGLKFILKKTSYTPGWSEKYVGGHENGKVVDSLAELEKAIFAYL